MDPLQSSQQVPNSASETTNHGLTVVVICVFAFLFGLIVYGMWRSTVHVQLMHDSIKEYTEWSKEKETFRPDLALSFDSFAANYESAMFVKCIALLMSYVLVVMGCLFVLQGTTAYYRLTIQQAQVKSALQTSSPGLVLITLGCGLVAIAIFVKREISISLKEAEPTSQQSLEQATSQQYSSVRTHTNNPMPPDGQSAK